MRENQRLYRLLSTEKESRQRLGKNFISPDKAVVSETEIYLTASIANSNDKNKDLNLSIAFTHYQTLQYRAIFGLHNISSFSVQMVERLRFRAVARFEFSPLLIV